MTSATVQEMEIETIESEVNPSPLYRAIESRRATYIILSLVMADYVICQTDLFLSLYDQSHPALDSRSPAAINLYTDAQQWTIIRIVFFSVSMVLKSLFVLELAVRIWGATPRKYFAQIFNWLDLILVVAPLVLKAALPLRESLIASLFVIFRFWRLNPLLADHKNDIYVSHSAEIENVRTHYSSLLRHEKQKVQELSSSLDSANDKLRRLMGEVSM
ncbi:uncharacterized protein BJ171DRAFT_519216 [Polychytrium aggregatum]|uniref:uncharacterized protein n=1 Tax=Polychytrium aggregatum TaxID=110093 RepID=UPI0022FE25B0|nr:uncharacterized protein BJ171DRAFT_519216 [Polychytrium aggregatum]KAI9199218.1 hypothetical protein BJ171DRAFT_519216 [Polychytrium aggregatum]